jgi:hypothetical protein
MRTGALVDAAEIRVMISGGFSAAYQELVAEFERMTKNKVVTSRGASMGNAPSSIPNRIQRGEPVDVLIMVGEALDELIKRDKVIARTRVDLARSTMGMAVRAGAGAAAGSPPSAPPRSRVAIAGVGRTDPPAPSAPRSLGPPTSARCDHTRRTRDGRGRPAGGDPLCNQSSTVRRRPGILVHVHPGHLPRMVGRLATTTIAEKGPRMDILLRLHN